MATSRSSLRMFLLVLVGVAVLAGGVVGAVLLLKPSPNAEAVAKPGTYLVSITGLTVGDKDYVDRFTIDTWGVALLATCRYPSGWFLRSGASADPGGLMEGQGSLGATYLDRTRLGELNGLFLIRLDESVRPQAVGAVPATFDGSAHIGMYGEDGEREARIDYSNVTLTPATACPPPPAK